MNFSYCRRLLSKYILCLLIEYVFFAFSAFKSFGQQFSGVDDLGRSLPIIPSPKMSDGKVGIFYFLWHGSSSTPISENVYDLSLLEQQHPEAFNDYHSLFWGGGASIDNRYYYWGEPLLGYYSDEDYWVQLKNIQLLTDAKIDIIIIDETNFTFYKDAISVFLKALRSVKEQGKKAPKVVFYTNSNSTDMIQKLYDNFFTQSSLSDLWFYLDQKPLIIGNTASIGDRNYKNFFTFRDSQWPNTPEKKNGWPWMSWTKPQSVFQNIRGKNEIISVSVAQHPLGAMSLSAFYGIKGNWGRSFHNGKYSLDEKRDIPYGYNFQEEWNNALRFNVPYVLVTGWNEWIARRSKDKLYPNRTVFVDEADPEYSRDIEPTRVANINDNYYMQLISNVIKYKGSQSLPIIYSKTKALNSIEDWVNEKTIYTDFIGDTQERQFSASLSGNEKFYFNKTGRNDIKDLKIYASKSFIQFYVSCVKALSNQNDPQWMTLWLNTDFSNETGWLGFDYRVLNGQLLQFFKNGSWITVENVKFETLDNQLVISIPISIFPNKIENLRKISFKWSDNMQKDGDPLDWYINGDAAPGGRLSLPLIIR
ncbi:hypothetical protein [Rhizosphaericola mali]|uniref:Uncharacterized protein n=1 Tax=Rhizosphaericola mali TaxID=2545455 RepID=A0A5P2G2A0_9BACT|nr:hypothetical protein [Rhizosphaericola mali]QES89307.1 hypothetical protein E0W69_011745 [Rhizosphaericola mali]